jgi:alpha-D-ribose 1-methylphosphonate 5-triphosphate synthase subunit PhnH
MHDAGDCGSDGLLPGFDTPVFGSQAAFRTILQALARPGRVADCGVEATPPPALGPAMTAVALTLVDADTPVWLAPALRGTATRTYLGFHCNAPIVTAPEAASFAFAPAAEMPELASLAQGTARYPDRSATLVVEVEALDTGAAGGWRLTGPGIADTARLPAAGLPAAFARRWAANRAQFPCGVDLILTCGERLAGVPRTTRVEAEG